MSANVRGIESILAQLTSELNQMKFAAPVAHVYNPLDYAWQAHRQYLQRFAGRGQTVLLGMNPGPFGMAQTGIPFGEIAAVRDWMQIDAPIGKPKLEHPKRPVLGLECPRSEVSGRRLWGWAQDRFGTPEAFFAKYFVINFCPLSFMSASGANITPDKLPKEEREAIYKLCDRALVEQVELLESDQLVGIGKFAEMRLRKAFVGQSKMIGCGLHPSPASPAANRGWQPQFEAQLATLGF